ncbi:hypothetical protein [Paenibacillus koleovorans]|uniref:hypothetical protein n=1 Tax=Paenibacillus koleovorans TaxID=121608 RepID=UPI000FD6DB12|nr:hypothetical protein [Paenibacillus koleovorans]
MSNRAGSFFGLIGSLLLIIGFIMSRYASEILSNMDIYLDEVVDFAFKVIDIYPYFLMSAGVFISVFLINFLKKIRLRRIKNIYELIEEMRDDPLNRANAYSTWLKGMGVASFVLGLILGIYLWSQDELPVTETSRLMLGLIPILYSFVGGIFLLAFGEIINLLQQIKDKKGI